MSIENLYYNKNWSKCIKTSGVFDEKTTLDFSWEIVYHDKKLYKNSFIKVQETFSINQNGG